MTMATLGAPHHALALDPPLEDLRAVVEHAAADEALNRRLGEAGVEVLVELEDGAGAPLALLFDRNPVEAVPGPVAFPDVGIRIAGPALERVLRGGQPLALAFLRGEASYHGPVRRLLRVDPVLRAIARQHLGPVPARGAERDCA